MNLNEFQEQAYKTAIYFNKGSNLIYPTLGLAGEVGEVVEIVKKVYRTEGPFDPKIKLEIVKELGDVLWYCAMLAKEAGYTLEDVAMLNVLKLKERYKL